MFERQADITHIFDGEGWLKNAYEIETRIASHQLVNGESRVG